MNDTPTWSGSWPFLGPLWYDRWSWCGRPATQAYHADDPSKAVGTQHATLGGK